jgi:hypothetical protein
VTGTWLLAGWMMVGAAVAARAQQVSPGAQKNGDSGLSVDSDPVPSPDPDRTPVPQPQAAQPQAGEITKENGQYTLRANAYEVRLNASVIDSNGQSVQDLPKDAFHVYEDGVPQTILSFRHEDVPVSLGILIDSSGSMYD